ncbi:hypothetical protein ACIQNT_07580 [Streptomyces luteogriseus]
MRHGTSTATSAHEDMGVMRPVVVMPARVLKSGHDGAHGGHGDGRTG